MNAALSPVIDSVLRLKTLQPSIEVNEAFSQLVDTVLHASNAPDVDPKSMVALRTVCGQAESELEMYWAQKIISSPNAAIALRDFPYLDNYQQLVQRELACLAKTGQASADIKSALIIGSGPLPLTAYFLEQHGIVVDHVDASRAALQVCDQLMRSLDMKGACLSGKGETVRLTGLYDLVLIAALAGENDTEKRAIMSNILPHLTDTGRVIVRSAKGARELLYPAVNPNGFVDTQLLHEYHPTDHVINSVLVFGKKEAE